MLCRDSFITLLHMYYLERVSFVAACVFTVAVCVFVVTTSVSVIAACVLTFPYRGIIFLMRELPSS